MAIFNKSFSKNRNHSKHIQKKRKYAKVVGHHDKKGVRESIFYTSKDVIKDKEAPLLIFLLPFYSFAISSDSIVYI